MPLSNMYQNFMRFQLLVSKFLIEVQRRQVQDIHKKFAKMSIFSNKICGFFKTLNGKSFTMPFSNMYQSFIRIQLLVLKFLIKVQRRQVSVFHKNLPKCHFFTQNLWIFLNFKWQKFCQILSKKCQYFHTKFMHFFKLQMSKIW